MIESQYSADEKLSIPAVLDKLEQLYANAILALRNAIADYINQGTVPSASRRDNGLFSARLWRYIFGAGIKNRNSLSICPGWI